MGDQQEWLKDNDAHRMLVEERGADPARPWHTPALDATGLDLGPNGRQAPQTQRQLKAEFMARERERHKKRQS
jgi:hypothetical protein